MGSWNKTCGLSNLHITYLEEVYVFVLEKADKEDSRCYTTRLYRPLLLPFESTYDAYGRGEQSKGVGFSVVMDALVKDLYEIDEGQNPYHDIAVTKDKFNEQLFFDAAHKGRLFCKGYSSDPTNPTKMDFVMMRKDVVDYILEHRVIAVYVGAGKGTGGYANSYNYYRFKDIVADIKPMLEEVTEKLKESPFAGLPAFRSVEHAFSYDHPNKAVRWLRGVTRSHYSRFVDREIDSCIFTPTDTTNQNDAIALLTEYMKGVFIDDFMRATNRIWVPQYEGGQDIEIEDQRLLVNVITKVLEEEEEESE